MGRRTDRLEYHGNTLTSREHFIYKGYVQIAAYKLDAERESGDCFVLSKSCYWIRPSRRQRASSRGLRTRQVICPEERNGCMYMNNLTILQ